MLFLKESSIEVRHPDGRLSFHVFNLILEYIGRRHDVDCSNRLGLFLRYVTILKRQFNKTKVP
jgi:hypothetical protein